ncbi:unnamed protein product [Diatraea saccharalis]|uniref:Carboxylic ester hydrolase n=1 Tax=Diatraea saccharalis TaxID=40085 RepID=A0A9N9RHM5_9NEOP|nr:unnamed protein product [Diatraea saccharalis]
MGGLKIAISTYILLVSACYANGIPRVDPLVDTELGLIRGLTSDDGSYSMFLGIPYATVNVSNPFGPSIPHPSFDNTFDAFDDSAICPQINEFTNEVTGTLDCLHLNVYVPTTASSNNRRPVMVWIYGGGFSIGFAGRYVHGPSYLVRHDVILVTLNYRIGPYGFMCLGTPDVPGNQGLKDQLMALRWVKNNIAAFGGDIDKITIFGESAGSVSVDFHFLYTQENLFNQIILQSGTALSPFAVTEPNREVPLILAQQLGFLTSDLNEALTFLTTIDTDLVIAANNQLQLEHGPCVEEEFENVERFISDHPVNMKLGNGVNIPILIGYVEQELLTLYVNLPPESYASLNIFEESLSPVFNFDIEYFDSMVKNVRQFYIGDEELSEDLKWDLIDFHSDITFNYPTYRAIQKYSSSGISNVYCYLFAYNGDRNFVKRRLNITEGSAAHADEISYLFDVSFFDEVPTPDDQLIIDRMTTLWSNFAKYGNPTPEETSLLPIQWPPVTEESQSFLIINSDLEVQQRPFHDRMAFWDLFYRLNKNQENGYRED